MRPDQLCHAKLQPRIVKPVVRKGHNTVPLLSIFTCGYGGADCASVSIDKGFENNGPKAMNFHHEVLSFNRPDIREYANMLADEGKVSHEMLSDWDDEYKRKSEQGDFELLTMT